MMFSIRFFKTKYAGLIGMFFSLVMFMTGCQRKDEAIVLIPSGEDVAEFPSLEAVEQAAEPAGSSVTVQEPAKAEPQMIYVIPPTSRRASSALLPSGTSTTPGSRTAPQT